MASLTGDGAKARARRAPTATVPTRRRFDVGGLLDAALMCFVKYGYDNTSMSLLAQEAGTTKPTLYERLGSKESIWHQVVAREAARAQEALEGAYEGAAGLSGVEAVELATRPLFDLVRESPDGFRVLYGTVRGAPVDTVGDRILDEVTGSVARLLLRWTAANGVELDEEDAHLLATMSIGAVRGAVLYAADDPDADLDAAQQRAADYLVAALFNVRPRTSSRG